MLIMHLHVLLQSTLFRTCSTVPVIAVAVLMSFVDEILNARKHEKFSSKMMWDTLCQAFGFRRQSGKIILFTDRCSMFKFDQKLSNNCTHSQIFSIIYN